MDIAVRSEAEKALVNFSDSPESLPRCQFILERSQVWCVCMCMSQLCMCMYPQVHTIALIIVTGLLHCMWYNLQYYN